MAGDVMWKFGASPLVDSARVAELSRPGFVCAVDRAQDVLGYSAYGTNRGRLTRDCRVVPRPGVDLMAQAGAPMIESSRPASAKQASMRSSCSGVCAAE